MAKYSATAPVVADGYSIDLQTDAAGNLKVGGNVASGAADSGNPVKAGAIYSSTPAAVTDGQRRDLVCNARGSLYVQVTDAFGDPVQATLGNADGVSAFTYRLDTAAQGYVFNGTSSDRMRGDTNALAVQPALSANFWQYAAASGGIVSSTADVALKAAGGAGVRNFLASITINHDTLSAATECVVKDGSTVIWRGKLQTAATDVANGAGTIRFNPPLRGTANTAMNFALISSVTGGVFVNAQGYTGA